MLLKHAEPFCVEEWPHSNTPVMAATSCLSNREFQCKYAIFWEIKGAFGFINDLHIMGFQWSSNINLTLWKTFDGKDWSWAFTVQSWLTGLFIFCSFCHWNVAYWVWLVFHRVQQRWLKFTADPWCILSGLFFRQPLNSINHLLFFFTVRFVYKN